MKKIVFLMILITSVIGMSSCTKNTRARFWGGTSSLDIKPGQKVVNVTWKQSDLWVLTAPMESDYKPITYTFYEKSSLGILQGTYYLIEHQSGDISKAREVTITKHNLK